MKTVVEWLAMVRGGGNNTTTMKSLNPTLSELGPVDQNIDKVMAKLMKLYKQQEKAACTLDFRRGATLTQVREKPKHGVEEGKERARRLPTCSRGQGRAVGSFG